MKQSSDAVLEEAVVLAATMQLVEQQIWLDQLPYQNAEHRCIVKETHETLSVDARAMIGLVLHYPDIVIDDLNNTRADNDWTVRTGKRDGTYNQGRTLNYIKRERDLPLRAARKVHTELTGFVKTLRQYTRRGGYTTVATSAMMEKN